ncbi:MAG: TRM11 family SAM-dependent methyltransferase [Acidimicrobiales bacterium]
MTTAPTNTALQPSATLRPSTNPPSDVPLALWPVGQTSAQRQRAGRYLPATSAHPAKMLPNLARRIIEEYSEPGDLVVDPMCGIGTTLAEAAVIGRRATGIESEQRWATVAEDNLDHMLDRDHRLLAKVVCGDARNLAAHLGDVAGTVDLVCVSPPYACDTGNLDKTQWGEGGGLCPTAERNYSVSRANLGHARGALYEEAMTAVYASCFEVLRPGGLLVTVTKNTRRQGGVFDLAGTTVTLVRSNGFSYLQHVVALHAAIRDGALVARPSFWQQNALRKARQRGEPAHLVAHEDVLAFCRPERSAVTPVSEAARAH